MPPWYKRTLSSEEALDRANTHLENARTTKDQRRAQKLCDEAKEALERIDLSKSARQMNQIAIVYREHGKLLEKLRLGDKAQFSYRKADELMTADQAALSLPLSVDTTPTATPSPSPASSSNLSSASALTSHKITGISSIFTKDCPSPVIHYTLPRPDERLISAGQLAFSLALLQTSSMRPESLDPEARAWLTSTERNQDEIDRLKTLATDLIRALARDELRDKMAITEVVCLAPVLEKDDFRSLLSLFGNAIKDSLLLDTQALEGLARLIQSATPGYMEADDLVKILELLSTRLQETFQQSPSHIYQLTITVSRVLDAMADCNIQDLDRVRLHEPLLLYLNQLKADKDPYMVYQAAYAYQALLCVPDDEEPWQAALRRSGAVIKGVGGLVSAIKGLNVAEFINGLSTIQEGLQGTGQIFGLVQDAYNGVAALQESSQGLLESLKNGLSFSHKRTWYAALRGADSLILNGELTKLKTLVCDAPCRRDLAFQWGICQRLGYMAAHPVWEDDSRKDAIAFLGEMYWNDEEWGQEPRIKQCILEVLSQLSKLSGHDMKVGIAAENLLRDLATDGDEHKQGLYLTSTKIEVGHHFRKLAMPPPISSTLMDQAQNKPSIEPALRNYERRRLEEQGQHHAVYIAPQAKASRESADDDLFDLTTKVRDFITDDGDGKVLLLLGDSGAGKSTFNLELEKNLWRAYTTDKKWIPVFVTLPAIDKPEKDLIAKQLRNYDFTEVQIRELKSYRQFVLICDGYDECQKKNNLYNDNRLNQPGEWNVKLVISCRSEFLGSDYRVFFQPGGRNDRKGAMQLQEAVIAPFGVTKINDYIQSYVAMYQSGVDKAWKVEDYENAIQSIPNLQELVRNPFLLSLALKVLPRLVDLATDFTSKRISRVTLYDQFVEQWVERGQIRLIERSLTGDDHAAFEVLSEDGFTQNAIGYVKDLAVAIFDRQDGKPVVEYSPIRDKASWKTAFFGHGDGKNLLRETCPLSRIGNQYRFIHRSVLEYGLARAVFEPRLSEEGSDGSIEQLNVQENNPGELSADSLTGSPLFRKSFLHEPSIINFLSERVQQNSEFEDQLHKFIDWSKTDDRFSHAAANAITILVRAGVRFNGADLRGIRVPGANLSCGDFDSAQLQGADLRNTTLRNVWLHQADLGNSQMEGAMFGEYPYLEMKTEVECCAFSPDGKYLTVGLDSGEIHTYDTSTWDNRFFLKQSSSAVDPSSLLSSHQAASGTEDETVRPKDEQSGYCPPPFSYHRGSVSSIAYSPCGRQIVSGSRDETVRLWDAETGGLVLCLRGHSGGVIAVAYSPNGRQIASSCWDGTVRLWDVQTGALVLTFSGHTHFVMCVAYSPDGQYIASGSRDSTVQVWDTQTGALIFNLSGHSGEVTCVAFSPSGHQIASGGYDQTVRLWDAQTGTLVSSLSDHTAKVACITYSPNGQQIASGGHDAIVQVWDAQNCTLVSSLSGHTRFVTSVAYSPSGHQIASSSWDWTVRLWDTQTSLQTSSLQGHAAKVTSVAYSLTGHQVATGSCDFTVRLWNEQTGALASSLSSHAHVVMAVALSPSGHQIASDGQDKTIRLWDSLTGALVYSLSGHTDLLICVAFSPDGRQIASGSWDQTVRVWDAQTGTLVYTLLGHSYGVASVVFSPTGHQIASGAKDRTIRLWDAQTGAFISSLSCHSWVNDVAFSPDGHQIAAGVAAVVQLWDVQAGALVSTLGGHGADVVSVAYSPSGHLIASSSGDKTVRIWDAAEGECRAVLDLFRDIARSIAWKNILEGSYIVVGTDAKSVLSWKVVEEGKQIRMVLHWRSSPDTLAVLKASIQGTQGLSEMNTLLLRQRGALGQPASP